MWAVATWDGHQRDGVRPWTVDDFRAAGQSDCADIMRQWNQYGRITGGTCIEIGCGSGRLTSALLDHFDRVLAIDVSVDQVELAKRVVCGVECRGRVFHHCAQQRVAARDPIDRLPPQRVRVQARPFAARSAVAVIERKIEQRAPDAADDRAIH